MCEALARLHRVRPEAANLADYGKPTGYLRGRFIALRQAVRRGHRWRPRRVDGARHRLAAAAHAGARAGGGGRPRRLPRGQRRVPSHRTAGRAILDWELSSLGDPLADFAYHLMTYRCPRCRLRCWRDRDIGPRWGCRPSSEYVERIRARHGGQIDPRDLEYYIAFGMFRLAGIFPRHPQSGRARYGRQRAGARLRHVHGFDPRLAWRAGAAGRGLLTLDINSLYTGV
jgi:aminoglycoside phosphotransferase (APT) family kinase protein